MQIQHGPATVIDRMIGLKSGLLSNNFGGPVISRRKWLVYESSDVSRLARLFLIAAEAADDVVGHSRVFAAEYIQ